MNKGMRSHRVDPCKMGYRTGCVNCDYTYIGSGTDALQNEYVHTVTEAISRTQTSILTFTSEIAAGLARYCELIGK